MRRQLGTLAACLAALFLCGAGARAWADDSLAVLGIDALDVDNALGAQLTDALRRRAGDLGLRLVPGKDLIELKMIFSCDGEAPACMAQAGRSLGADRLIYGSLKRADSGRAVAVSLKLLDVRELAVVKSLSNTIPRKALTAPAITAAAQRWLAQLVPASPVGALSVMSQPADAEVLLDGQAVGRTPLKLKDVKPRSYTLTVRLDGYEPQTRTIEVTAGGTTSLNISLPRVEPAAPPAVGVVTPPPPEVAAPGASLTEPPPRPLHPGRAAKYAALGLAAGAVVAGAVAIYTWRSYVSLEDQAHSDLLALKPAVGTAQQQIFYGSPGCDTPPGASAGDPHVKSYLSHCSSGGKYAAATTGLWISAGVLATAGIVALIMGQTMDAKANKEKRGLRQSLRLLPAVSTRGGGLSASFEF